MCTLYGRGNSGTHLFCLPYGVVLGHRDYLWPQVRQSAGFFQDFKSWAMTQNHDDGRSHMIKVTSWLGLSRHEGLLLCILLPVLCYSLGSFLLQNAPTHPLSSQYFSNIFLLVKNIRVNIWSLQPNLLAVILRVCEYCIRKWFSHGNSHSHMKVLSEAVTNMLHWEQNVHAS